MERKIRAFLSRAERHVGPSVSSTLVRVHDWIASVQSGGLDAIRIAAKTEQVSSSDIIETIAESLTKSGNAVERRLLSKSLQETLFYCVGFDTDMSYSQFKAQLEKYLNRYGASSIVQLFLSLYFFNFVWFETGDSFRALVWSPDAFEKNMEEVEAICKKVVYSVWKKFEQSQRPLDLAAARELILEIEQQLRGVHAGNF